MAHYILMAYFKTSQVLLIIVKFQLVQKCALFHRQARALKDRLKAGLPVSSLCFVCDVRETLQKTRCTQDLLRSLCRIQYPSMPSLWYITKRFSCCLIFFSYLFTFQTLIYFPRHTADLEMAVYLKYRHFLTFYQHVTKAYL